VKFLILLAGPLSLLANILVLANAGANIRRPKRYSSDCPMTKLTKPPVFMTYKMRDANPKFAVIFLIRANHVVAADTLIV